MDILDYLCVLPNRVGGFYRKKIQLSFEKYILLREQGSAQL
jgi:hypothetical protein